MADSLEQRRNARLTAGDSKIIETTVDTDISGATVRYAVTDGRGGQTVVGPKDSSDGSITITTVTADESVFRIELNPKDTDDLLGRYHHEAELVDADGDVTTVFTGQFIVRPNSI
jgi:hypothetical protein